MGNTILPSTTGGKKNICKLVTIEEAAAASPSATPDTTAASTSSEREVVKVRVLKVMVLKVMVFKSEGDERESENGLKILIEEIYLIILI